MIGKKSLHRACVISFPMGSSIVTNQFLCGLLNILTSICERIFVVTSNIPKEISNKEKIRYFDLKTSLHLKNTITPIWLSNLIQFSKIILIQIKMCWILIKISNEIDVAIFYVGGSNLFIPAIMAKILGKKIITFAIGSITGINRTYDKRLLGADGFIFYVLDKLEESIFLLSDKIIVDSNIESENLIHQLGLTDFKHKVSFGGVLPVDTDSFYLKDKLKDRKNIIGYLGRLSPEKGIINLAKAIPLILKERDDLEFLICGGGVLFDEVAEILKANGSCDNVTLIGWVPHDKLPDYLNSMKLIVVPSYTETIPYVILEAMSCGTPVVANSVSGIPDLIVDGVNGFLMKDNSPICIAENVIRVLNSPELDQIVSIAQRTINANYTKEIVVDNYKRLILT